MHINSSVANLRIQAGSLPQKRPGYEPEAVRHRELVLDYVGLLVAGMRIVPLVGRESGHYEQREGHQHVSRQDVQPNLHSQGVHKTE